MSNLHPLFEKILQDHGVAPKAEPKTVEKIVGGWRHTDKHPCPECGAKLGMPDYFCQPCNIKLKLKVQF